MTTIRPNLYPQTQAQPQDAAKLAAQRAFFNAAMGQGQAAAAPAAPRATVAPQQAAAQAPVQRAAVAPAATSAEQPQKILRPGSLFDIRV